MLGKLRTTFGFLHCSSTIDCGNSEWTISNDALPPKWTGGDDEVARLEEEEEGKACILEERVL